MSIRGIERLATASGAELATLIPRVLNDLARLTDSQRLEFVKATARLDAWTAAARAEAIGAVFESARAEMAADAAELAEARAAADQARLAAGLPVQADRRSGLAGLAGLSHGFDEQRLLHRRVGTEVALVLGVSTWVADREVDLALGLARYPRLRGALREGLLDRSQAVQLLAGASSMDDRLDGGRLISAFLGPDDADDAPTDVEEHAQDGNELDQDEPATDVGTGGDPVRLVPELTRPGATLWALPAGRLRMMAEREAIRIDPAAASIRASRSRSERRVVFDPQPGFMTELHLRTTTEAATAAYTNLDATARAAQHAGDQRNLDQLRADIAIGWLTEGAHGTYVTRPGSSPTTTTAGTAPDTKPSTTPSTAPRAAPGTEPEASTTQLPRPAGATLTITVAATTALGLDQHPATLHGPTGPIPVPADIAREIAHRGNTRWRRLLYDPGTGIATDLSPTYRPPRRMADFVRARDGHLTRFPISCATHLELDHVQPYQHSDPACGGPTTPANLSSLGQRDHHLVTDRAIQVSGNAQDALTITTASGRTYPSHPHIYASPDPPPY